MWPSARIRSISSVSDNGIDKRSSPMILKPIERASAYTALDIFLANPTPDDDIIAMLTHLNTSIAEHVQKYMDGDNRSHLLAADISLNQKLDEILGSDFPVKAQKLAALLRDRRTRAIGFRHILAWSILVNVKSVGAPETTLLPPEISECMSSMTGMKGDTKGTAVCLRMSPETLLTDLFKAAAFYSPNGDKLSES